VPCQGQDREGDVIINIRGTSGSGKSTAIRNIVELCGGTPTPMFSDNLKKPDGYSVSHGLTDIYVVGSYENVCGGCDGIKTQDEVCRRVREYSRHGHVLFEGLLLSTLYERYRQLALELDTHKFIFAFLDTPLDVCLSRVASRRAEAGRTAELNPKNTTDKWHLMRRMQPKFHRAGLDSRWVGYEGAASTILGWLP